MRSLINTRGETDAINLIKGPRSARPETERAERETLANNPSIVWRLGTTYITQIPRASADATGGDGKKKRTAI